MEASSRALAFQFQHKKLVGLNFHFDLIIDSVEQPSQHKYWGKERIVMIMLRQMTSGRGVDAGV